jgi:hypothetical protein
MSDHENDPIINLEGVIADLENAENPDRIAIQTLSRVARQMQAALLIIRTVSGDIVVHAINEVK